MDLPYMSTRAQATNGLERREDLVAWAWMAVPNWGRRMAVQDLRTREKTWASRARASEACMWWKRARACSWLPWLA